MNVLLILIFIQTVESGFDDGRLAAAVGATHNFCDTTDDGLTGGLCAGPWRNVSQICRLRHIGKTLEGE